MKVLNIQFKYIIIFFKNRYIIFLTKLVHKIIFLNHKTHINYCKSFALQSSLALIENCLK